MQIFLLISFVIAVLAVVFALQNAVPVTIAFLVWRFDSSLALVLLAALGIGVLISFLATLPSLIRGGWTTSSQKRQLNRLEKQLADNQAKLLSAESKLAEKEQVPSEGAE